MADPIIIRIKTEADFAKAKDTLVVLQGIASQTDKNSAAYTRLVSQINALTSALREYESANRSASNTPPPKPPPYRGTATELNPDAPKVPPTRPPLNPDYEPKSVDEFNKIRRDADGLELRIASMRAAGQETGEYEARLESLRASLETEAAVNYAAAEADNARRQAMESSVESIDDAVESIDDAAEAHQRLVEELNAPAPSQRVEAIERELELVQQLQDVNARQTEAVQNGASPEEKLALVNEEIAITNQLIDVKRGLREADEQFATAQQAAQAAQAATVAAQSASAAAQAQQATANANVGTAAGQQAQAAANTAAQAAQAAQQAAQQATQAAATANASIGTPNAGAAQQAAQAATQQAQAAAQVANQAAASAQGSQSMLASILGNVRNHLGGIQAAYRAGGGGITGIFDAALRTLDSTVAKVTLGIGLLAFALKRGLDAFQPMERAVTDLDSVLANNGQLTDSYRGHLQSLSQQMSISTGVAQEEWLGALTELTKFGANPQNIEKYAKAVENLAGATGQGIHGASRMFGRAMEGNTMMLSRFGIFVTQGASKTQKLNEIMEQAAAKGGGVLENRTKTMSGAFKEAASATGDFFVGLGNLISKTGIVQNTMVLLSNTVRAINRLFPETIDAVDGLSNKLGGDLKKSADAVGLSMKEMKDMNEEGLGIKTAEEHIESLISKYNELIEKIREVEQENNETAEADTRREIDRLENDTISNPENASKNATAIAGLKVALEGQKAGNATDSVKQQAEALGNYKKQVDLLEMQYTSLQKMALEKQAKLKASVPQESKDAVLSATGVSLDNMDDKNVDSTNASLQKKIQKNEDNIKGMKKAMAYTTTDRPGYVGSKEWEADREYIAAKEKENRLLAQAAPYLREFAEASRQAVLATAAGKNLEKSKEKTPDLERALAKKERETRGLVDKADNETFRAAMENQQKQREEDAKKAAEREALRAKRIPELVSGIKEGKKMDFQNGSRPHIAKGAEATHRLKELEKEASTLGLRKIVTEFNASRDTVQRDTLFREFKELFQSLPKSMQDAMAKDAKNKDLSQFSKLSVTPAPKLNDAELKAKTALDAANEKSRKDSAERTSAADAKASSGLTQEQVDDIMRSKAAYVEATEASSKLAALGRQDAPDKVQEEARKNLRELTDKSRELDKKLAPLAASNAEAARMMGERGSFIVAPPKETKKPDKARPVEDETLKAIEEQTDSQDVIRKMATHATRPGSIYVHDTHSEKLLEEIIGERAMARGHVRKDEFGYYEPMPLPKQQADGWDTKQENPDADEYWEKFSRIETMRRMSEQRRLLAESLNNAKREREAAKNADKPKPYVMPKAADPKPVVPKPGMSPEEVEARGGMTKEQTERWAAEVAAMRAHYAKLKAIREAREKAEREAAEERRKQLAAEMEQKRAEQRLIDVKLGETAEEEITIKELKKQQEEAALDAKYKERVAAEQAAKAARYADEEAKAQADFDKKFGKKPEAPKPGVENYNKVPEGDFGMPEFSPTPKPSAAPQSPLIDAASVEKAVASSNNTDVLFIATIENMAGRLGRAEAALARLNARNKDAFNT